MPPTGSKSSIEGRLAAARPDQEGLERERLRAAMAARLLGDDVAPPRLGRYVVTGQLGAGAMGVVYSAHDPKLDRDVAIKVVEASAGDDGGGRARRVAEARALAKLSHPNVVAVLDVGVVEDRVWIAMELVEGSVMSHWLRAESRPWREVLAVLRGAGRGLAAAHRAGLVHRDFKPDNVIIGGDGRAQVLDFGLARPVHRQTLSTGSTTVAGTPGYIAPEVMRGEPATVAADQFAFCVTAWEALFGRRPDVVDPDVEPRLAPQSPQRLLPRVPLWLRRAVARGLAVEPSRRFADMDALLIALDRGPSRTRRRRLISAVVAGAAVATAVGVGIRVHRDRRGQACREATSPVDAIWNEGVAQRMRAAMLATGAGYAETTWARVAAEFDVYRDAWNGAAFETCMEVGPGSASQPVVEPARWCLELRQQELASTMESLVEADDSAVRRAIEWVGMLSPPDECRDPNHLRRVVVPTRDRYDAVVRVRAESREVHRLLEGGQVDRADTVVRELQRQADALDWGPLRWKLLLDHMEVFAAQGDFDGAIEVASAAYFEAAAAGRWDVAARAASGVVTMDGFAGSRLEHGLAWSRHARAAFDQSFTPEVQDEPYLLNALAALYRSAGQADRAMEALEDALELQEANLGPDNPRLADLLGNLAITHAELGDSGAAAVILERAIELAEGGYGADHPKVARLWTTLGIVVGRLGEREEGHRLEVLGQQIRVAALGPEHVEVAEAWFNLGVNRADVGDLRQARAHYERALEIFDAKLGPGSASAALTMHNLALVRARAGDPFGARRLAEQAKVIREATGGSVGSGDTELLQELIDLQLQTGDPLAALQTNARRRAGE